MAATCRWRAPPGLFAGARRATVRRVEDGRAAGSAGRGDRALGPPAAQTRGAPWQPPRSHVDRAAEESVLVCARSGQREDALKILMATYGSALTAFATRILRDRELVKDVRQQVFLEVFQGLHRFEGRSSLWTWICGIAYHRCLDELRRHRRIAAAAHVEIGELLAGYPDTAVDADRVAKQRALEACLGKLPPAMRSQLLLRYFLGLSYMEIAEVTGIPHGTVQVRICRILPRLRQCLRGELTG